MKKIISTLIIALCLFGIVCVAAELPALFSEPVKNATLTSKYSLKLDNADEVLALIDELGIGDELVSVDLEKFINTLSDVNSETVMCVDSSDDYTSFKLYSEETSSHKVEVNDNLSVGVDAKECCWLDADFNSEEPTFKIIYNGTMSDKYIVIDIFELIGTEYVDLIKTVFNAETINEMNSLYSNLILKYAEITEKDGVFTVKFNNDSFLSVVNELVTKLSAESLYALDDMIMDEEGLVFDDSELGDADEDVVEDAPVYHIKDLQILGENGLEAKYVYKNGQIVSEGLTVDLDIDFAKIFEVSNLGEWPYESCSSLELTVTVDGEYSKVGKTEIEFPELTEENSIDYVELMSATDDYIYDGASDLPSYPSPYIWCEVDNVISVDGEFYLPLRTTMESAYEDQVFIEYMRDEAGKEYVAMISLYFPEFSTIAIEIGSETYYADTNEIALPAAMIVDGTTYVPVSFFENVLGWELGNLTYDVLYEVYNYTFWAEPVSFDMSDIDFSGLEEDTIVIEEESEESDVAA